ncbi:MAG: leucine-rich repeat domain-containing protein [Chitinophagales bacterium]
MKIYIILLILSFPFTKIYAQTIDSSTFFQEYVHSIDSKLGRKKPANYEEVIMISAYDNAALGKHLKKCKNLVQLTVRWYDKPHLKALFENLADNESLQILYLTDISVDSIPKEIELLPNLAGFNIFNCDSIQYLPPEINNIKSLQQINISLCKACNNDALLDVAFDNKYIKDLKLTCLGLKKVPNKIAEMKQLEELSLGQNLLEEIPKVVLDMPNLRKLNVSWNYDLAKLPCWLKELKMIEEINIRETKVKKIPPKCLRNEAFEDVLLMPTF